MSEQPENEAPRVTDKRGKQKPLPTAQELLDQDAAGLREATEQSEFQRQAEEERARLAAWEDLTEDEKQAILAQHAAEEGGLPFAGGGIQTDGVTKREVLTTFAIVVELDGTATVMPMSLFDEKRADLVWERDADARVMYRSAAEIMLDIQAAETSHLTLQMFKTVGDKMAAQQRGAALAQGLAKRGVRPRG